MPRRSPRSSSFAASCCLLAALAGSAHGQGGPTGPTWVSLNPLVGPGTPPTIAVNTTLSNTQQTVVDVVIPGFYSETISRPGSGGGVFKALSLPKRSLVETLQEVGKPALPVLNMMIGIPTDAATAQVQSVTASGTQVLTGYENVMPDQPDMDEAEDQPLIIPPFEYDRSFYTTSAQYPSSLAQTTNDAGTMRGVRIQPVGISPFVVNPATGELTIHTTMRIVFAHAGTPGAPVELTKRTFNNLAPLIPNLPANPSVWVANTQTYKGAFLFIAPADKIDDIQPLIQQKKERGFKVTVRTTAEIDAAPSGLDRNDVEAAINAWYYDNTNYPDRYVQLVGDYTDIPIGHGQLYPLLPWRSDFHYACVDGDYYVDMDIGRITFTDANPTPSVASLSDIVARILAYEDNPPSSNYYQNVLLTAHREVEANFVKNMQKVEATAYDTAPNFSHLWGTEPNGTTANAFDAINDDKHLVYYRGHGGTHRWHEWDFVGAHLHADDIPYEFFPNHPSWSQVFINSACANGAFQNTTVDSLCEELMENDNGPVAAYGATSTSRRDVNDLTTFNFFELMYDHNISQLSLALSLSQLFAYQSIEWSGGQQSATRIKNISQYVFFGDPEMKMYTANPDPLHCPGLPSTVGFGPQSLAVQVQSSNGQAMPGALVAIYKDGEFDSNAYADGNGQLILPINPTQPGVITLRAYSDDTGRAAFRAEIAVRCPADFNNSGAATVQDLFDFLAAYFANDPSADVNDSGAITVQDIFDFLAIYFRGC